MIRAILAAAALVTAGVLVAALLHDGSSPPHAGTTTLRAKGSPWVTRRVALGRYAGAALAYLGADESGTRPTRPLLVGGDRVAVAVRARSRLSFLVAGLADGRVQERSSLITANEKIIPRAVAFGGRGAAAVAYSQCRATGACALMLATRPVRGAPFGRPQRVFTGGYDDPAGADYHDAALAFGPGGELVIAYADDGGHIQVRLRTAGRRLGRPRSLGPQFGSSRIVAASNARGDILVAWATQDGGIETELPLRVNAVFGSVGSARFGRDQLVDRGVRPRAAYGDPSALQAEGGLDAALGPDGSAVISWERPTGLYAAATGPARRFGAAQKLGDDDMSSPHVAAASGGGALVTWNAEQGSLLAAMRPPGAARFGALERIPGGGLSQPLYAIRPALDPHGRRAQVSWLRAERSGTRVARLTATRGG
jgi:hypothetical protein